MNKEQVELWRKGAMEHCSMIERMVKDRKELKSLIEEHIGRFFKYDSIEYNKDLSEITIEISENNIVIPQDIGEIQMDWNISSGWSNGDEVIIIKFYPFGAEGV